MLPDPESFADCIQGAYDELKAATLGRMSQAAGTPAFS